MRKLLFILLVMISFSGWSQSLTNMYYRGDMNSWGSTAMSSLSLPTSNYNWVVTIQSDGDNSESNFKFANTSNWSDKDWSRSATISINEKQDWNNAWSNNTIFNETNTKNYVFTFKDIVSTANSEGFVYEFSSSPVTISNVTESNTFTAWPGQNISITATLSASKPSEQKIWLRYSTSSNFSSSTIVSMSFVSGNDYSANIPSSANTSSTDIYYYAFSTGDITATTSNADPATINFNKPTNNSYTVENSWTTKSGATNWSSASSWDANETPAPGQPVTIEDNITLDQDATVSGITISSGTLIASDGSKATRTLTIASGGTFTNNSTFDTSDGTVVFAGSGSVAGSSSTTFNNLEIQGDVDFGTIPTIDGTLTLNANGTASTNSPVFGNGSNLNYNMGGGSASKFNQSLEWPASNGPSNVDIENNTWIQLTSGRSISGNLTITNGALQSFGGNTLTMNGTSQTITVSNSSGGAIYGTDNGDGNDLSLSISDGSTTTFTGDATSSSDDEKKFFNVTVNAGGTLALNRGILCRYGTFAVNGTLQINSNGYIQSVPDGAKAASYSSGTLIYNSGGAYGSADFEWPTSNSPSNVRIQNSGTNVTLNNAKTVAGHVNVESGAILASYGYLTLLSDQYGTASLISEGTVSGNVTVQRFVDEAAKAATWHYVSSPVVGQALNDDWMTNNGILTGDGGKYQLFRYDEDQNYWIIYGSAGDPEAFTDNPFVEARGYSVAKSGAGDLSFTGTVRTSNVSYAATYTTGKGEGWNLVGNPFTSPIGVTSAATSTGKFLSDNSGVIDNSYLALYIWNEETGYENERNDYQVISSGNISGYDKIDQDYIQSGQAFMVKVSSSSNLAFNTNMQQHATAGFYKSKEPWPSVELLVEGNGISNSTSIGFNDDMTAGLDSSYDVGKLKGNPEIALYTRLIEDNGVDFAIQALPINDLETYEVPVGVDVLSGGTYEFSANETDFENYHIVLEDRQENIFTNLRLEKYSTDISENGIGRFFLHFKDATAINNPISANQPIISIQNNQLTITNLEEGKVDVKVVDIMGRMVDFRTFNNNSAVSMPLKLETGIYILEVSTLNNTFVSKFFNK